MHARVLVAGERGVARDHRRLGDRRDAADAERGADGALVHARRRARASGPPRAARSRRRTGAGTAAPCAACRRSAPGRPSSVKPTAPSSRSSAISVSCSPSRPRVIAGQEADRDARFARGGVAQRAQQRRGVEHGVGVGHREHRRRSRRRRRRACRVSRSSLCSCPGVRRCTCGSKKAGQQVAPAALDAAPRRARRRACRARASSAISPPRTRTSWRASIAGARVEHVHVAQQQVGRLLRAAHERVGGHHAGWRSPSRGAGGARRGVRRTARSAARWRRRAARRGPPCARRRRPRPAR